MNMSVLVDENRSVSDRAISKKIIRPKKQLSKTPSPTTLLPDVI